MTTIGLHHHRLDDGTDVVAEVRPRAASAAVGWFVRVGSRDEPAALAGVSHFLEHMAFKGAGGLDADALNRRLDALGARSNAFTGEDRTGYFGSVLPEHLGELNALLGAMMDPTLDPADVESERQVILEEIAMSEDEPESRAFEHAAAAYFGDHPLARPILGDRASVGAIGRDDLRGWVRRHYRPERRVVVLCGRLDLERELDRIADLAEAARGRAATGGDAGDDAATGRDATNGETSAGERAPATPPRRAPTPRAGEERRADARLTRVYGAALAPGVALDAPERVAAALLARVLGEPGQGALHWALVDPGLSDDAGLTHEAGDGFGTFGGWFSTSPRREAEVRERFAHLLRSAQEAPVDRGAWKRAQRTLAADATFGAETPFGRLMGLADDWIGRGALETPARQVERILACPPEAGEALLARRPFDRMLLSTLGPARRGTTSDAADESARSGAQAPHGAHPRRVP